MNRRAVALAAVGISLTSCGRAGFDLLARGDGAADDAIQQSACPARDVDVGRRHACMIDAAGGVWCWGFNDTGQAAPANPGRWVVMPSRVALPTPAEQLALGRDHSCALLEDRTGWCWGYNNVGQLGNGVFDGTLGPTQIQVSFLIEELAAGAGYGCVRPVGGGALYCWGSSSSGENGRAVETATPVAIAGTDTTSVIALGHRHSCTLTSSQQAVCWGLSGTGQLGSLSGGPTPSVVPDVGAIIGVAAASRHTCVVDTSGQVKCMGDNFSHQLGDGTMTNSAMPVAVVGVSNADAVVAGVDGACARRIDGTLACWGATLRGDGTFDVPTTATNANLSGVTKLASGYLDACVIARGNVLCWGRNNDGELGRGTRSIATVPTLVDTGGVPILYADIGSRHVCARTATKVLCWGLNGDGQLGNGTRSQTVAPIEVATGLPSIDGISVGFYGSCAWSGATLKCWGANATGQLSSSGRQLELSPATAAFTAPGGFATVALGRQHTCVVVNPTGTVHCVGGNAAGQLGNGTTTSTPTPITVTLPGPAATVVAGESHTCALVAGAVHCWGFNGNGQIGDNSTMSRTTPVPVTIAGTVVSLRAGNQFTCALTSTGQMYCWGENGYGQLGLDDYTARLVPTAVPLSATAREIATGDDTACALLTNGTSACWGNGRYGQLANGDDQSIPMPTPALLPSTAASIQLGGGGGCALDGSQLMCWGFSPLLATRDSTPAQPQAPLVSCP